MKLINKLPQLIENISTVEHYLTKGSPEEQTKVLNLIKRGSCFIAYEVEEKIRFAPSRFLGYISNSLEKHTSSHVDGTETNPAISTILNSYPSDNDDLKTLYLKYCENLGVKADNKKHKFWKYKLSIDFNENKETTGEFPEGKIIERIHKDRERNSTVIKVAKEKFKAKHGKLFCEICEFSFEDKYGTIGIDFIEGHHTIAVSEMNVNHKTKPEDIAMLCSNCHKMVHKRRPWLSMNDLKKILEKTL